MFRMLRTLLWLAGMAALVYVAVTVPMGKYTLWGHLQRIWHSQETQDMVKGTEQTVKPAAEKVKKAVEAGVDEAKKNP
jgi:hypothetical protein